MNRKIEMDHIKQLLATWFSLIRLNNAQTYTDINKISESLSRQLLNTIYDYQLQDLNKVKSNYPGLDLGNDEKDKIAFQVTSRTDREKLYQTLRMCIKKGYDKSFTRGIKMLILNDSSKIEFTEKTTDPQTILSTFDIEKDILYPDQILKDIEDIYEQEANIIKFYKIKNLLQKELELKTNQNAHYKDDIDVQSIIEEAIIKISSNTLLNQRTNHITIDNKSFYSNLDLPNYNILSQREYIVNTLNHKLNQYSVLWINGPYSIGKTSLSILIARKRKNVYWIDCKGLSIEQIVQNIVTLFSSKLNINSSNFEDFLIQLMDSVTEHSTFILNDLPLLYQDYKFANLEKFILLIEKNDHYLIVTSNYEVSEQLSDHLKIFNKIPNLFGDEEIKEILQAMGAGEHFISQYTSILKELTEGHPLVFRLAAKYLRDHKWIMSEEKLNVLFSGSFINSSIIYPQIANSITDPLTKVLLYRLKYPLGNLTKEIIHAVAEAEPKIDRVDERIHELDNIWIQQSENNIYQLSPIIKKLGNNATISTQKEIFFNLAKEILKRKKILPIEGSMAIQYLINADKNQEAASVLFSAISQFTEDSEQFYLWGYDKFWYKTALPCSISPDIRILIRATHLELSKSSIENIPFIIEEIEQILAVEEIDPVSAYYANYTLYVSKVETQPIESLINIISLERLSETVKDRVDTDLTSKYTILDGIWYAFSNIKQIEQYEKWFNIIELINLPESVYEPFSNEVYRIAALSLYNLSIDYNITVHSVYELIINRSMKKGLYLLATYAHKFIISNSPQYREKIINFNRLPKPISAHPIYNFLIQNELAHQFYYSGKQELAIILFKNIDISNVPDFYLEKILYYENGITFLSKYRIKHDTPFANDGLKYIIRSNAFSIIDKAKMNGEVGLEEVLQNNPYTAIYTIANGFSDLLNNFQDNDENKAILIRYGHLILYMNQILKFGHARDFDEKTFANPLPGFFFLTNDKLLQGDNYFDGRKFGIASLISDTFELIGDFVEGKKWSYRTFELAIDTKDIKFAPILLKITFYLIKDKQYKQAYGLLRLIQKYYDNIDKQYLNGSTNKEVNDVGKKLKEYSFIKSDINIYINILFPWILEVSIEIVTGTFDFSKVKSYTDLVFNTGELEIANSKELNFAKELIEKILIQKIKYSEIMQMITNYDFNLSDWITCIAYILRSSFAEANEAANLQLNTISKIEPLFKSAMPTFYHLGIVSFFESFWDYKIHNHMTEFHNSEFLLAKGLPLIRKTSSKNKVAKTFFVLDNHLILNKSEDQQNYIDSASELK